MLDLLNRVRQHGETSLDRLSVLQCCFFRGPLDWRVDYFRLRAKRSLHLPTHQAHSKPPSSVLAVNYPEITCIPLHGHPGLCYCQLKPHLSHLALFALTSLALPVAVLLPSGFCCLVHRSTASVTRYDILLRFDLLRFTTNSIQLKLTCERASLSIVSPQATYLFIDCLATPRL